MRAVRVWNEKIILKKEDSAQNALLNGKRNLYSNVQECIEMIPLGLSACQR
jgi:hypothetical protein